MTTETSIREGYQLPANEYALVEDIKRKAGLGKDVALEVQCFLCGIINSLGDEVLKKKDILKPMAAVRGVTRLPL